MKQYTVFFSTRRNCCDTTDCITVQANNQKDAIAAARVEMSKVTHAHLFSCTCKAPETLHQGSYGKWSQSYTKRALRAVLEAGGHVKMARNMEYYLTDTGEIKAKEVTA